MKRQRKIVDGQSFNIQIKSVMYITEKGTKPFQFIALEDMNKYFT